MNKRNNNKKKKIGGKTQILERVFIKLGIAT
jgi:hypothetical protein